MRWRICDASRILIPVPVKVGYWECNASLEYDAFGDCGVRQKQHMLIRYLEQVIRNAWYFAAAGQTDVT